MSFVKAQATILPDRPAAGTVRLAHTADNHLRLSASGSTVRGTDFLQAMLSGVEGAAARGAAAMIVAGDMINAPENLPAVASQLQQVHKLAAAKGLPVLAIQGNHDMAQPSWIEICGAGRTPDVAPPSGLSLLENVTVDVRGLKVRGMPFMAADALREQLSRTDISWDVLTWHGSVQEFAKFPTENSIKLEDFAVRSQAAVLLGDIHVCEYYVNPTAGIIGYSGATELCKRDEPLTHTVTLLDFVKTGGAWQCIGFELIPVKHRPVVTLNVDREADLEDALRVVRSKVLEHGPILVLATYNAKVEGVRAALYAAAGEHGIVRVESYTLSELGQQVDSRMVNGVIPDPATYLPQFVSMPDTLAVCNQLVTCGADSAGNVLQQFVEAQMSKP